MNKDIPAIFSSNDIPPIGFGPAGLGYTPKRKKKPTGILLLADKVWGKLYRNRVKRAQYVNAIAGALKMGFRLLDYSCSYGDGRLLGQAVRQCGVPREQIFITTRISNKAQTEHRVREEFLSFIKNMGVQYVDLLQFHWPVTGCYLDTWREMERLYDEGYVKHLGVANCHQHHLEEIFKICRYRPEVGQFEIHPLFSQKPLVAYYQEQGIAVEAYTPLARYDDRLVRLPLLKRLEKKYQKSFIQIILRWHVQNGIVPLVRALSPSHQKENFNIFDFELSAEDMALIDGININSRLRYDPDNCDFSIL